jgi:hypothetical protein
MGTRPYKFRVQKDKTQFQPVNELPPMPTPEWEEVTERLSDENLRRFPQLDESAQGILYRNWQHTAKDQMTFDAWLTKG